MKGRQYDQKEIKFYFDTILHFATQSPLKSRTSSWSFLTSKANITIWAETWKKVRFLINVKISAFEAKTCIVLSKWTFSHTTEFFFQDFSLCIHIEKQRSSSSIYIDIRVASFPFARLVASPFKCGNCNVFWPVSAVRFCVLNSPIGKRATFRVSCVTCCGL